MNGRDWLRRQRRTKPATGGVVSNPAPIVTSGCALPAPRLNLDDAEWPPHTITFTLPDTDAIAERLAETEHLLRRDAHPDAPTTCPCRAIYSRCYCQAPP